MLECGVVVILRLQPTSTFKFGHLIALDLLGQISHTTPPLYSRVSRIAAKVTTTTTTATTIKNRSKKQQNTKVTTTTATSGC